MSADFWAGYLSGAVGILVGNPLDLLKTRLQSGSFADLAAPSPLLDQSLSSSARPSARTWLSHFDTAGSLVRGSTFPIAGYGLLNAILFVTYNRCLSLLGDPNPDSPSSPAWKIWTAGAAGGLATFVVSAPTELVKCRAQVAGGERRQGRATAGSSSTSSLAIAAEIWRREGVRGFYWGGGVTSVRDAVGYGFYFWSYQLSKRALSSPTETETQSALKVLVSGGLAGIVTWASIFPLDVIKTRVQTQESSLLHPASVGEERASLLGDRRISGDELHRRKGALEIARIAYETEGISVFFKGLGICSIRAFIVNAVQFAVYELVLQTIRGPN